MTSANYTHRAISYAEFLHRTKSLSGHNSYDEAYYSRIEYMNSPHGIIVLAHRDYDEAIEGIHPASLSDSIERPKNIVQPLTSEDGKMFNREPIAYNQHWMTRRSQGSLVLAAFGKMIDGGDEAAPCILPAKDSTLHMSIYEASNNPVIFIFHAGEEKSDVVYVIQSEEKVDFIEEGQTKSYPPEFIKMTPEDEAYIQGAA